MNIVLLGSPGSGKGTQARELSAKLGLLHLSLGDILWSELDKKTPLGQQVGDYLSTGCLVPDWLVLGVLKERLAAAKNGFLLDGFPGTMEQGEGLDTLLAAGSLALDAVVYLNLPEAEAVRRLVERRICAGCGMIFNRLTAKPRVEDVCDFCGGALKPRNDDKAGVVKQRVMAYRVQTEPLISYYRRNAEFFDVKADQPPQAITDQILALLKPLQ